MDDYFGFMVVDMVCFCVEVCDSLCFLCLDLFVVDVFFFDGDGIVFVCDFGVDMIFIFVVDDV